MQNPVIIRNDFLKKVIGKEPSHFPVVYNSEAEAYEIDATRYYTAPEIPIIMREALQYGDLDKPAAFNSVSLDISSDAVFFDYLSGNDATGDGSQGNPYKTVAAHFADGKIHFLLSDTPEDLGSSGSPATYTITKPFVIAGYNKRVKWSGNIYLHPSLASSPPTGGTDPAIYLFNVDFYAQTKNITINVQSPGNIYPDGARLFSVSALLREGSYTISLDGVSRSKNYYIADSSIVALYSRTLVIQRYWDVSGGGEDWVSYYPEYQYFLAFQDIDLKGSHNKSAPVFSNGYYYGNVSMTYPGSKHAEWYNICLDGDLTINGVLGINSAQVSGSITGDTGLIQFLIEDDIILNDNFQNTVYLDFQPVELFPTYEDQDDTIVLDQSSEDVRALRLSLMTDTVGLESYDDDAASRRALWQAANRGLSVEIDMDRRTYEDARYPERLIQGAYLVSDDVRRDEKTISKQAGNYIQFDSVAATDKSLLGYVMYIAADGIFALIKSINSVDGEAYYYVQTINANNEEFFAAHNYVTSSVIITYKLYSLIEPATERLPEYTNMIFTLRFSQKRINASGENILVEAL